MPVHAVTQGETPDTSQESYATLPDIRRSALTGLPVPARDFLEGGAGDEWTLRRNVDAFSDWLFKPRLLAGVKPPELATSFLGVPLSMPVVTGPIGADALFHPEGQKAVARAAAKLGVASMAPEASSFSAEELHAESPSTVAFGQFHPVGSESSFLRMLERLEATGFRALVLTCDCPTAGWRERNLRNSYSPPHEAVRGNYPDMESAFGHLFRQDGPTWSWRQLGRVMRRTTLPWMAKGIMTADDAMAAIEAGASAIGVSNHGGRQLDGQPGALDVLPEIVDAVGGEVEISFDGGIRRGADVVKALALGADVVLLGRLVLYGLAAGGETGVVRVLELLRDEIGNILTLLGRGSIGGLDRAVLRGRWQ
ncbi:alpha-hydroxy-acid oxidizing enzyme [Kibdelosporangium aridum]|uniref:Alpha-hydroxy-acid oxidizing enzyme n=1 Tax=Kibdelosporangium aridum TaxID=2030 RepID=A0A428Y335_KIBAR|nr:alpha-hydroxy acid oxidase [Kibdelosporangium aridum]RSM61990.1 alpha-hydroxy-acid oxidizing enzyme [Kibdelosporangium aridum]